MDILFIQLIAVGYLVAALFNRKINERLSTCLFFLLISMVAFIVETKIGGAIGGIPRESSLYLWAVTVYYAGMALLNFSVIFFISLLINSDYKWLIYPVMLCLILNLLIPLELIFLTKMSQNVDELRYIKKGYSYIAEIISVIEIILLVADNHGNRTRIKQFVASWTPFVHPVSTLENMHKDTHKDEK